jgi:hypothetical protein
MPLQLGMLSDKAGQRLANGVSSDLNRGLLARILAKRRWNLDLGHVDKDAMVGTEDAS